MTNKTISWDEYFMEIAEVVAKKSKDQSTKVGCVIVDENNRIISTGYNGLTAGCDEEVLSYDTPDKYNYIIHSEMNAILSSHINLSKCKLYTTFSPCDNCLKHILQSQIKEVIYKHLCTNSQIKDGKIIDSNAKYKIKLINSVKGFKGRNISTGKSYLEELKNIL